MGSSQDRRRESRERMRLFQEWITSFGEGADRKAKSYFLATFALALLLAGLPMIGITVNLWIGATVMAFAFTCGATALWLWEGFSRFHLVLRWITVIMAGTGYCAVVGQQIWTQYEQDHPLLVLDIPKWPIPHMPSGVLPATARSNGASPVLKENPHRQPTAPGVSSQSGTAVGTVTVQPGAVASFGQQGGQTAGTIINVGPPSYPTLDKLRLDLTNALSEHKGSVAFNTHNASGSTLVFANALAGVFHDAGWSVSYPGVVISGTDIGPDGRPVEIPTGIHIHARTLADPVAVFVNKQLNKVAQLDSVVEPQDNLADGYIAVFVGEPDSKR